MVNVFGALHSVRREKTKCLREANWISRWHIAQEGLIITMKDALKGYAMHWWKGYLYSAQRQHISFQNWISFSKKKKYVWIMNVNVSLNNLSALLSRIDPFVFPLIKVFHRIWKHIFLPPFPLISARHCTRSIASLQRHEVGRFALTSCAHPFFNSQVS